jgi:protein-S-isoprenylcysteine O-methyltransferase Ste14
MINLIGKPTINPIFFYSGKICGYILWILLLLYLLNISPLNGLQFHSMIAPSYILIIIGLLLVILSSIFLGKSTRLGLPTENTVFKKTGIYQFSRNPMYLGFNMITLSSIVHNINIVILLMGFYSIFIYHLIILGEENYLLKRYGKEYEDYKIKVRRYI